MRYNPTKISDNDGFKVQYLLIILNKNLFDKVVCKRSDP